MKKEVKILGLAYAKSQIGSYILVLSEEETNRKIPIIVKPIEAQKIASEIESVKLDKPNIYDTFKNVLDVYDINISEVNIHTLLEGIFYTNITTKNDTNKVDIECSVGDGILLSIIKKCPIFVSDDILESVGVMITDDGVLLPDEKEEKDFYEKTSITSISELNRMLEEAVTNQEYEIAAKIRDRINELKENK